MHKAGLLNSKEVKDPRNSENIPGCIQITRNNVNYDIKYDSECSKIITIKGDVTTNFLSWEKSTEVTVQLIKK